MSAYAKCGLVGLSLLALSLAAPAGLAETVEFTATLQGSEEVPPVETSGQGEAEVTYDTETRNLTWTITYSDLSGPPNGAHFHGPAEPGENAGVAVPIPEPLESPMEGEAELTEEQASQLMEGQWYLNIHTAQHPDGEIRGQVERAQ